MFSTGLFRLLAISALIALAMSLALPTPATSADGDDNEFPVPEKPELAYPNLGSTLDQLVTMVEKGEASAKQAAEDAPVHQEESVAVTIYLSENVADVVKFLEDNGASPRNVGEDYIEAYVPVSLLGQVSEQPGVIRVREIIPPEPAQTNQQVAGHGPPVHGSMPWNQAGYDGQGVKVGVIDLEFSFNDFAGLTGTELPSTVQARCYTSLGRFTSNLSNCGNALVGSNHGTRLAEAVMDIAPEASLYIATSWSKGDTRSTVDWMLSQGVSVIVHGVNYVFDGPGDGTSPFGDSPLKTVDRAVAGGIVWVNAAGNEADSTWFGNYSNRDSDDWIEFDNGDIEANKIALSQGDVIRVQLRWEGVWGRENTDLDMVLYDSDINPVWYSGDYQTGPLAGDFPIPRDYMRYEVPSDGDYYLAIRHQSGLAPDWIQMVGWGTGTFEYHTENGSIGNPAESANHGMLAAGAAPWYDVNTIETSSSRGPTPDGRVKPDIVGADCGATALRPLNEYGDGFCGTSQAAPHVAGLAALVAQRFPTYTAVQVANYLKEHAEQRAAPDPNNTWGHGFAKLPPVSECSAGVAVANAAGNPGLVSDCEALLAARDSLAGTGTLNWSGSTAIGSWDGVTLGGSPPQVTKLVLRDSQLAGTIPLELGSLATLVELDLGDNRLTGPIPSALASLTNLEILSLTRNQLSGSIPPGFSGLTSLEILALGGNQLAGPIPTWMGSLTNLQGLYLWGNQLTGPIPSQLASLTKLERLSLSDNQLTGLVPTWLGSLTNLEWLYLSENRLTGPVPPELGSLTNLQRLRLSDNQLTGMIPTELGSLTNLEGLYLWGNQLTGQIPSQLASLTKLERLSLSDNQLTGSVPSWLGSFTNLEWLYMSRNQLTGQIPSQLASLTKLERLSLYDNQLSGPVPTWLGSLTNLEWLYLSENRLTGMIPTELGSLTNLEELFLSGNQLTGCIPSGIAGVANNDLDQLALPFCAGASGAPTMETVTPGADFLTVTWTAASVAGGTAITAYDLRYIESAASDKSDANWSIVDNAWTTGSGALSYQISGLTSGTQYDVQVRGVTAAGDGRWSAAVAGTPATWAAIRSFSPPSVGPGGQVVATIAASGFGPFGQVTETLPPGFDYVSSSQPDTSVTVDDRKVSFILLGETQFTYTVTAPSAAGTYSFSGVLTNSDGQEVPVGGALMMRVGGLPSISVSRAAGSEDTKVRPGSPVSLTATFSRPVSGFTIDDITVGNGAVSNFAGSGAVHTFDVTPNAIGEVTVDIAAGVAQDADGNGNAATPRFSLGITYDDDDDGGINKAEAIAAIRDYFKGLITKAQAIVVIRLYFAPPR